MSRLMLVLLGIMSFIATVAHADEAIFQTVSVDLPLECSNDPDLRASAITTKCTGETIAFVQSNSPIYDGTIKRGNGEYYATGLWAVRPNPGLSSGWGSISLVTVDRAQLGLIDVSAVPSFKRPVGELEANNAFVDFLNANDRGIVNLWVQIPVDGRTPNLWSDLSR